MKSHKCFSVRQCSKRGKNKKANPFSKLFVCWGVLFSLFFFCICFFPACFDLSLSLSLSSIFCVFHHLIRVVATWSGDDSFSKLLLSSEVNLWTKDKRRRFVGLNFRFWEGSYLWNNAKFRGYWFGPAKNASAFAFFWHLPKQDHIGFAFMATRIQCGHNNRIR